MKRRKSSARKRTAWQGTEYNERMFHKVRNALVGVYLDGVKGVSPNLGHSQMSPEDADRYIKEGAEILRNFKSQEKIPRGATYFMKNKIRELQSFLKSARAVRRGGKQKMTAESYGELLRYTKGPR